MGMQGSFLTVNISIVCHTCNKNQMIRAMNIIWVNESSTFVSSVLEAKKNENLT